METTATKQAIGPNQEKWLQALESGEFKQGFGTLARVDDGVEYNCCLGVYGRVSCQRRTPSASSPIHFAYGGNASLASDETIAALAIRGRCGDIVDGDGKQTGNSLAGMNDLDRKSFAEIAAFCRANPEAVFTEPR